MLARVLKSIPMQRSGRPEEATGLVAFLCAAKASYITGRYMVVDGGSMETYF